MHRSPGKMAALAGGSIALALSTFAFCPDPACAGVNAGGVLLVHAPDGVQVPIEYSTLCGLSGLTNCQETNTQLPVDDDHHLWFVIAAFPTGQSPRLQAVTFGLGDYDPSRFEISDFGSCAQLEIRTDEPAWPSPGSGTAVVFTSYRTTLLTEIYWFTGYASDDCTFPLAGHPTQGGTFGDPSVPAVLDPIEAYGTLGFGSEPGDFECPVLPNAVGACCVLSTGVCSITQRNQCNGGNRYFLGEGSDCDPNPCPIPAGACCIGSTCSRRTRDECVGAGGVYYGNGTPCTPNPCPPTPTGACCLRAGGCVIRTSAECPASEGTWKGDNTICDPSPCDFMPGTGACCISFPHNNWRVCLFVPESTCMRSSRSQFLGVNVPCRPSPCSTGAAQPAQPSGGCCIDGECLSLPADVCAELSGIFIGVAEDCPAERCSDLQNATRTSWGRLKSRYGAGSGK
ncbi:MAG: hypothetical protein IT349_19905 [Candidatus Eisenbacteria bacterium]|nr:hypothetical protein [Candidatus Eisenbacteria bacterium]